MGSRDVCHLTSQVSCVSTQLTFSQEWCVAMQVHTMSMQREMGVPFQPDDLLNARGKLRRSERRPSFELPLKPSFQRRELSILHQGWLMKQSRHGTVAHWNRRWFILIGGSLYYSRSAAPSVADLHVFTELLEALNIELVPSTAALMHAFRIVRSHRRSHNAARARAVSTSRMPIGG